MDRCETGEWDAVVLCGDLTHFGPLSFGTMVLEELGGTGLEVFYVGGNCDPKEIEDAAGRLGLENVRSLHRRGLTFRGLGLAGHGGSTGMGGTPGEYSEEEVAEGLGAAVRELPRDRGKGPSAVDILVTHTPARGTLDTVPSGEHIGSSSVEEYVGRLRPALALSGHVHERSGTVRKAGTLYVNPGPLRMLRMASVEVTVGEEVRAEAGLMD
jgi:Icc-related predicted phosphoesterase